MSAAPYGLPPGFTLEDETVTPAKDIQNDPRNKLLYTTPEGIPVYGAGPKETEDLAWKQPEGSILERTGGGFWDTTIGGFLGMAKDAAKIAAMVGTGGIPDPNSPGGQVIMGMVQSHLDQAAKAKEAWEKGRTSEAFGHGLAASIPMIGPGVAHAAEQFGVEDQDRPVFDKYGNVVKQGIAPDIARGVGEVTGILGGSKAISKGLEFAGEMSKVTSNPVANAVFARLEAAVERMKDPSLSPGDRAALKASIDSMLETLNREEGGLRIPALFPNSNAAEREAYKYMREDVGIPPNAAMATGSPFVRGSQYLTAFTPAGAVIEARGKGPAVEALRTRATKLVEGAMPLDGPARDYYADLPLSLARDGSQIYGDIKVPVDIRDLKYELQPLYDKMKFMPMAERSTSAAYSALQAFLEADDFVPGPTAEWGLGQFKAASRMERGGVSEALAKRIIPKLQALIDDSVKTHAGDEAVGYLQQGRAAAAKEAGATWLTEQFEKAQAEGGFEHEKVLWNNWKKITPTAKRSMFTPAQVAELDKFFLGLKMRAENPNPSGTALVGTVLTQGTAIAGGAMAHPMFWLGNLGAAGLAKLLRSDKGVALLTQGLRIPRTSSRGRFIERQLREILGDDVPKGNAPPGPGGQPPPAGGGPPLAGGPGIVTRLNERIQRDAAARAQAGITTPPPNQPAAPGGSAGIPDEFKIHKVTPAEAQEWGVNRVGGALGEALADKDFSRHLPPPEGERVSPYKSLQPPDKSLQAPDQPLRRNKKLEGSLHVLRRAAEREPGVGGPDNRRVVLRDKEGQFVVGKITPEDWVRRVGDNLSADEMVKARRWYGELEGFFNEHFGEEQGPKMALAWLSSQQNVSPSGGMTNVLRALDQLRGMPKEKVAGLAEAKILAALRGEAPTKGMGAKLHDFVDSAMGKTTRTWMGDDPRGGQPAVIDVWANRDVGKIDKKLYNYLKKRFGEKAVSKLELDGKSISETDYEYGSRFYNDVVKALNESGYDGGGWTGEQVQAVGWTAMQKAMGATPEFAADLVTKNSRRYGWEVQPGEGAPILQQYPWHELSIEQQAKVTEHVGQRVTDLAAQLTGAKITSRVVTRGAYQGKPTISVQMDVFASPETFRDFSRAAGYLGQQSEVWNVRPLKSGNSRAYFIQAEGLKTPAAQQTFWEKLRDRVGADLVPGYSPISGEAGTGIFIVNPFSKQYLFERKKAGFKTDTSLKPWNARDKAKIDAAINEVEAEMGLSVEYSFDNIDLGSSIHNWARKGRQNGHIQRLVETGRSTIADQLLNHASDSLQSWWKEAWDQFVGSGSRGGGSGGGAEAGQTVRTLPPKEVNPAKRAFEERKRQRESPKR
jgi:hypothetical protein